MEERPQSGKRRRRGRRLLLLALSLTLALGVAEVAARVSGVAREVGPSLVVFDPRLGVRLRPDVLVRRRGPEFDFTVTTNALGQRGPEPSGPVRDAVLCLGDSFTLGHGVGDDEDFPALLRREMPDRIGVSPTVLNAGVPGTGNGRWVKVLKEEARAWSPAVVVLQVCGNDYADNEREKLFTLGPDGELIEGPSLERSWSQAVQSWIGNAPGLSNSHLVALVKQALADRGRETPAPPAAPAKPVAADIETRRRRDLLTLGLLQESFRICAESRWPAIVLGVGVHDARLTALRTRCSESSVPLLVMPTRIERPDFYFAVDGHWTPAGHRHAAALLLEAFLASPAIVSRLRNRG